MVTGRRAKIPFCPEDIAGLLDTAYTIEMDDRAWLAAVMRMARAVWKRDGPAHGAIYDASDVTSFRPLDTHFIKCSDEVSSCLMRGIGLITPGLVMRTFRSLLADYAEKALPEMLPMYDEMAALGFRNVLNINGLDPEGLGVFVGLWETDRIEPRQPELALSRRLAHHLGAAHRCRRRLRESQTNRSLVDATEGAEAILDARGRILYAVGPAKAKASQLDLIETAKARDRARTRTNAAEGLRHWRPLTSARWTLVESYERNGTRYIVARENQSKAQGLTSLSDRERQVVSYLAIGQSTKETAYALGISDATVRVLLARAASKLGVRSRGELLGHAEVRTFCTRPRLNVVSTSAPSIPSAQDPRRPHGPARGPGTFTSGP